MPRRRFNKSNRSRVRKGPGVYKLYKKGAKKPTYIGSSRNVKRRISEHGREKYRKFEVNHTASTREAKTLEKRLIRRNKPKRNIALK